MADLRQLHMAGAFPLKGFEGEHTFFHW
jgi:hypothetical protein